MADSAVPTAKLGSRLPRELHSCSTPVAVQSCGMKNVTRKSIILISCRVGFVLARTRCAAIDALLHRRVVTGQQLCCCTQMWKHSCICARPALVSMPGQYFVAGPIQRGLGSLRWVAVLATSPGLCPEFANCNHKHTMKRGARAFIITPTHTFPSPSYVKILKKLPNH